ncbi:MAG: hypothetical protein HY001_05185 [Candidatus Portnoybacteria bacterium]|nr:hypothetical protein [Candidatus Portnoybacteria bacterium]
MGKNFPEIIRDRFSQITSKQQEKANRIYALLQKWQNYLLKEGYKGTPAWAAIDKKE